MLSGMSRLSEYSLFFREFLRNFHTTGAVLPSGRFLAAALARFVAQPSPSPRRILEVGPGTGAVTRRIIAAMGPLDRLDLVELNEAFVRQMRHRFESDPAFQAVSRPRPRAALPRRRTARRRAVRSDRLRPSAEQFLRGHVEQILAGLTKLLADGGTLSFFEYIAVRPARAIISGRAERARLRGIGQAMHRVLEKHEIRRDAVLANVPPAWVHHVRV